MGQADANIAIDRPRNFTKYPNVYFVGMIMQDDDLSGKPSKRRQWFESEAAHRQAMIDSSPTTSRRALGIAQAGAALCRAHYRSRRS